MMPYFINELSKQMLRFGVSFIASLQSLLETCRVAIEVWGGMTLLWHGYNDCMQPHNIVGVKSLETHEELLKKRRHGDLNLCQNMTTILGGNIWPKRWRH